MTPAPGSEAVKEKGLGVLAIAGAAGVWGTLGLFLKPLYSEGASLEAVVAVRAVGGWAVVTGFLLLSGGTRRLRVGARDLALLVPQGFVGVGLFYLLYHFTIREGTVGTAAILLYSSPAFVVLLAWAFLREPLGITRVSALVLVFVGVLLVVGAYDLASLEVRPLVLATGLLSGLTYGLYSVFGKPLTGRLDSAVILCYALGVGAVVVGAMALPTLHTLVGLPPVFYVLLAVVAIVHTALGFALYTVGLRRLEAGQASITATLEPVVAVAAGALVLGEELKPSTIIGGALVLAGAALAQAGLRPAVRRKT